MALTIEIANRQKRIPLSPLRINRTARKILDLLGIPQARLSLVFVTDSQIRRLNKQYLNRDRPTDVLAFDLGPGAGPGLKRSGLDGEIVVSAVTAVRRAREYGLTPYQEMILYVVHGILHLAGYDDHTPPARKKMRRREEQIMACLFPGCRSTPPGTR